MRALFAVVIISLSLAQALPAKAQEPESLWQNMVNFAKGRLNKTFEFKTEDREKIFKFEKKSENKKKEEEKKENENDQESNQSEDKKKIKEIEEHVKFASEHTGVSKDFLMGMLVVESALGQKTGDCTYREVEEGAQRSYQNGLLSGQAWRTFLERKSIIQHLANRLGYNHQELKVSCNPAGYVGTGGAMGVGQFMPDTWLEYEDRIAEIVNKKDPDPWDMRDGVVAMALKVSDVPGVTAHNVWSERNASKLYLSGTTSWQYDWYANEIQYWAKNYQQLIS